MIFLKRNKTNKMIGSNHFPQNLKSKIKQLLSVNIYDISLVTQFKTGFEAKLKSLSAKLHVVLKNCLHKDNTSRDITDLVFSSSSTPPLHTHT